MSNSNCVVPPDVTGFVRNLLVKIGGNTTVCAKATVDTARAAKTTRFLYASNESPQEQYHEALIPTIL
jgi:hypothetical protein